MTAPKQCLPSFASIVSVLSLVFYCVGFLRVELILNEHKTRINALENAVETKASTNDPNLFKLMKNAPGRVRLVFSCREVKSSVKRNLKEPTWFRGSHRENLSKYLKCHFLFSDCFKLF